MLTGQNPVKPTTQATKYYKSLSILSLLPFLPRERLVASPGPAGLVGSFLNFGPFATKSFLRASFIVKAGSLEFI